MVDVGDIVLFQGDALRHGQGRGQGQGPIRQDTKDFQDSQDLEPTYPNGLPEGQAVVELLANALHIEKNPSPHPINIFIHSKTDADAFLAAIGDSAKDRP
ncbi:MAG: hypothetical protein FD137_831 [Spirochaetes bacterium]|nr:MAG: hypothetical protein FD137_831 [Spirochaetota bacterium]